jgi:hypothetical protein
MPTVDFDAADGNAGNDNGNGDHYLEHNEPVFNAATMQQGDKWGDIIPPIPGIHNGLNWTVAGQAIYNNGCSPVTSVTPTAPFFNDVCESAYDTYTIFATTGVDYQVGGVTKPANTYLAGSNTVTVTAVAQPGYVLTGTTSWTFNYDYNVACTISVTPATVTFNEACGILHDTLTIPSKTGVVYKVGLLTLPAGTYPGFGTVTVTAHALPGYVLTGTASWTHKFDVTPCYIQVTPTPVTFNDACGTDHDTYTIPTKFGVVYKVGGNIKTPGTHKGQGSITVTAVALPGFTLTGATSWSNTFVSTPCPIQVTPGTVTFAEACGTANDTYTIPSTTGVVYKVNNQVVGAGTNNGSGSVTVTAEAEAGYVLTGDTSWTHTFTNEDCPVPPVDACKNIDGPQATVPFGMTVDNAGNCTTPSIPQILGDSTTSTTPTATSPAELVNTGSTVLVNLFVGLFLVSMATLLTFVSRKTPAQASFNSSSK